MAAYASNPRWSNATFPPNENRSWPSLNPTVAIPGSTVTREVVVYNDVVDVAGTTITFKWRVAWEKGANAHRQRENVSSAIERGDVAGGEVNLGTLQAGFHSRFNFTFVVPSTVPEAAACNSKGGGKILWLVMDSVDTNSGDVLFTEDRIYLNVTTDK